MNKKMIWLSVSLLIGLIVMAGGVVALLLMNQSQDNRNKASTAGGTVAIGVVPTSIALPATKDGKYSITLNTQNTKIGGVSYRMTFAASTPPAFSVKEQTVNTALGFSCQTNSRSEGSIIYISGACIFLDKAGFSNNTAQTLADVVLTGGANNVSTPVVISFDKAETKAFDASRNDVASIPNGTVSVTVINTSASPTPTPTPTPSPTPQSAISLSATQNCNPNEVKVKAEIKEAGQPKGGVSVEFEFNSEKKTAVTNTSGVAEVTFGLPAQGTYTVAAQPTGYSRQQTSVQITACATPTPPPGTTTVQCNQSCNSSRVCTGGLSCVAGVCRNTRCQSDSSCTCNGSNVASQSGTTNLPNSGSLDRTLSLLIIGGLLTLGGMQIIAARYWKVQPTDQPISDHEDLS